MATSHLYPKLSVHLMKGNSALLLNRIPNLLEHHVDGQTTLSNICDYPHVPVPDHIIIPGSSTINEACV